MWGFRVESLEYMLGNMRTLPFVPVPLPANTILKPSMIRNLEYGTRSPEVVPSQEE